MPRSPTLGFMRPFFAAAALFAASALAQSAPDFAPPATYNSVPLNQITPSMYWSAAGDFNGDGRTDLASVDTTIDSAVGGYFNIRGFSVVLATPTGFAVPVSRSIGVLVSGVVAADFNNDGLSDLVVYGSNGAFLLLADGTGGFGAATPLTQIGRAHV